MVAANPTGDHAPRMPWYARTAATAGRPFVLATALLMCVPAERQIAKTAGWQDPYATGMPLALSAYAGIAAVVAANRPKGTRGRVSAVAGAAVAIALALAAQVIAHLISTGHMDPNQAWLVGVVSAVPPAVAAHLLHLAATPATRQHDAAPPLPQPTRQTAPPPAPPAIEPVSTTPAIPRPPATPPRPRAVPANGVKKQPRHLQDARRQAIRRLYDAGTRPQTGLMRDTIERLTGKRPGGSTVRYWRDAIEDVEPHLKTLPQSA